MQSLRSRAVFICAAILLAPLARAQVASHAGTGVPHMVVELRQYTLHPGKRDVLINIFERNFVEGQEAQGMRIIGQFRDLDDPDRFVWLRSFEDMPMRATALNGFYFGPVWQSHRNAANPTMVDSDNVLLLSPARVGTGFPAPAGTLPARDAQGAGKGLVVASIVYLRSSTPGHFADFFEKELKPEWEKAGAPVVAELTTRTSANNFPRLPVREGEKVYIWFTTFKDHAAYDKQRRALAASPEWRVIHGKLSLWTHQPIETLRLEPTARSRFHGGSQPARWLDQGHARGQRWRAVRQRQQMGGTAAAVNRARASIKSTHDVCHPGHMIPGNYFRDSGCATLSAQQEVS